MERLWSHHVGPLIREIAPARICQIGAGDGWTTRHLLDHARRTGGHVEIVEPRPSAALRALLAASDPMAHTLHEATDRDAIPHFAPCDVVLLDGDPNWQTVTAALSRLEAHAGAAAMPVVLVHGAGWPYARRDGYSDPTALGEPRPHAYRGMLPGLAELVDAGVGGERANALEEGGPANGVLTAVEDFVAPRRGVHLWVLPLFGGLAIIVPQRRLTPGLVLAIDGFYTGEAMLGTAQALEADCARAQAQTLVERRRLDARTDALVRARRLLTERAGRIAALEAELAGRRATSPG